MTNLHYTAAATVLFALMVVTSSTANLATTQAVDLSEISISTKNGDRQYNGRAFTGIARDYGPTGAIIREEQFVSGRRHGYLKVWFPDARPAFEGTYANGRREGLSQSWWSNGQRRSETWFVDDKPHGVALSWYSSGEKYKRYQYDFGTPTGLQQAWRKNGKLYSNFEYRNGRAFGLRNSNLCVELDDENIEYN